MLVVSQREKLNEGVGLEATVNDIKDNPYNVEIVELEAALISKLDAVARGNGQGSAKPRLLVRVQPVS